MGLRRVVRKQALEHLPYRTKRALQAEMRNRVEEMLPNLHPSEKKNTLRLMWTIGLLVEEVKFRYGGVSLREIGEALEPVFFRKVTTLLQYAQIYRELQKNGETFEDAVKGLPEGEHTKLITVTDLLGITRYSEFEGEEVVIEKFMHPDKLPAYITRGNKEKMERWGETTLLRVKTIVQPVRSKKYRIRSPENILSGSERSDRSQYLYG